MGHFGCTFPPIGKSGFEFPIAEISRNLYGGIWILFVGTATWSAASIENLDRHASHRTIRLDILQIMVATTSWFPVNIGSSGTKMHLSILMRQNLQAGDRIVIFVRTCMDFNIYGKDDKRFTVFTLELGCVAAPL